MIIIYILFFYLWLLIEYKKHGKSVSFYILSLYCIGVLAGSILYYFYPTTIIHKDWISLNSVSFHCVCMFLLLFPIIHNGKNIHIEKFRVDKNKFVVYCWLIIIPSLLSIILSASDVINILAFNNYLDARNAFLSGDISNLYVNKYGLIGYVASLGPQISFLAIFFLFYRFFVKKNRDLTTLLLFISSFSMVINNLAIAGRDGIVRWFIFLGACFVIFRNYYSYKENKKLFKYLITGGVIILIPFFYITIDRYGESDHGALYSVLRYPGEPYYLFSYNYNKFFEKGISEVGALFPILTQKNFMMYNLNSIVNVDYHLNSFSTIAGSFLVRTGGVNCFAVCMGWFVIISLLLYKPKSFYKQIRLGYLVSYLFFSEVVTLGMFYYIHGARFTQFSIIFYIILAYCLQYDSNNSKRIRERR